MLIRLLAPLLSLAILASASRFPVIRRTESVAGDWCAGLGGDTIDNIGNFTLAAWNSTGNNTNDTGNPLVLSSTGSTTGSSSDTWATWHSYPYNDWPSLTMTEGGIKANGRTPSVAISAMSGSLVFFLTTNDPPAPAQIFYAVPSNDIYGQHPHPYLAVHGRYDKWSLCAKIYVGRPDLTTWMVAYDITAGVQSYDYSVDTCYPVLLNVVAQSLEY